MNNEWKRRRRNICQQLLVTHPDYKSIGSFNVIVNQSNKTIIKSINWHRVKIFNQFVCLVISSILSLFRLATLLSLLCSLHQFYLPFPSVNLAASSLDSSRCIKTHWDASWRSSYETSSHWLMVNYDQQLLYASKLSEPSVVDKSNRQ